MTTAEYIRQHPARRFQKGELLFQAGEPTDTLLAIRSGFVKIVSYSSSGDARFLWLAGKYDIIPSEHLFLRSRALDFFYVALTDVAAYEIDKADFIKEARANLPLMTDAAIGMSTHYDDLLTRINAMEEPSVRRRLLATLCHIAERFSGDETVDLYELGLPLTHQDLAEMVNSTRETTTLELQKLRGSRCISYARNSFVVYRTACKAALETT